MAAKWVYLFREGNADMRTLLGGKGANLAEIDKPRFTNPSGLHCDDRSMYGLLRSGEEDFGGN